MWLHVLTPLVLVVLACSFFSVPFDTALLGGILLVLIRIAVELFNVRKLLIEIKNKPG